MKSKSDKAVIVGRGMEYGIPLHSNIVVEPTFTKKISFSPLICSKAVKWENQYDVVCIDAMNKPLCSDGMNSAGRYTI